MSIRLLQDLAFAVQLAFWPTVAHICHTPSVLFRPAALSRFFFSRVWTAFGPGVDGNNAERKALLITPNAHGVVLDVGAGHGHTATYLDTARVTTYVALEPNVYMHNEIRRAAEAAGFTEAARTLVVLACGAEDTTTILTTLGGYQPVDTVISLLTLCSVPEPQDTIKSLATEVLKPGGKMLFLEHVLDPRPHIAWWQRFWSPLWALAFDGCRMDRPTNVWIQQVGGWADEDIAEVDGQDEEHLFPHSVGKLTKAA